MIGMDILQPVVALMIWTMIMWVWMYATRIPAMQKNPDIDANRLVGATGASLRAMLPERVNWKADNYNHLHEQPTVFFALVFYSHLVGVADELNVMLAWAYVALRVAHSLIQAVWNYVPVRFLAFILSSLVLIVMAARNVWAAL